jgi:hypothetical protein
MELGSKFFMEFAQHIAWRMIDFGALRWGGVSYHTSEEAHRDRESGTHLWSLAVAGCEAHHIIIA